MSIILGLLSLFVSIALPVLILFFIGYEALHFSIFFIIPIGALIIGYICGYGYYKGLFKSNTYITGKHYFIGLILSLICILGVEYSSYVITCIDPQTNAIVYSLDGDHVSNYYTDEYGQLDFLTYKKYMIETTPVSFSYKNKSLGDVSNPIVGWIFTMIDYLGVIVGCLFVGSTQKDHPYCHTCKLYKKEKEIFNFPKMAGEGFFTQLENSLSKDDHQEAFNALLESVSLNPSLEKNEHFLCKLIYCDQCKTASLKFELHEFNSKNKLEINSDFDFIVDVDYESLMNFIHRTAIA
ncbi:hypothetical protein [Crassaminicella profunda]|uniref:hypothetical protein n=1 Tax=Crassaminicella profunda TaxID=1286698 RepID=UPI001CA79F23|nr:hypothetical protein [Crassaminicella profunda]QZY55854.1 hypothetical protein K7H06_02215 [Crassaminicella profunda]